MGDDRRAAYATANLFRFLSTSPVWGTTAVAQVERDLAETISIHVPRMGDDRSTNTVHSTGTEISIHVPRMGDDQGQQITQQGQQIISIHVPRMGDDRLASRTPTPIKRFLSTSPVWGTTLAVRVPELIGLFLSTSPVWGTTICAASPSIRKPFLSTSPVWGTTSTSVSVQRHGFDFYPRPPYGGRLQAPFASHLDRRISIHVPRMGDDDTLPIIAAALYLFLSTSPVWGTTCRKAVAQMIIPFLSTSPVWGTTCRRKPPQNPVWISIHVPRMGDDIKANDLPMA